MLPLLTVAQVVAGVDTHYKNVTAFHASFTEEYVNTVVGKTTKSKGTVDVKKPQMRWDYTAPAKLHFVSDGKSVWSIDEANKQVLVLSLAQSNLPAAVAFLTGQGSLASTFNAATSTSCTTKGVNCVELTPKQASAQFTSVTLGVDPNTYEVEESIVLEPSGNTNHFWFTGRTGSVNAKTTFTVDVKALVKQGYSVKNPTP
jgi:outer membrane lipoprotein-sorting protein